ncbi:MAG: amidohydrolase family protein [Chloroflexi bacterium]|nr:amidohydrolase family protein [Chloroflexota bacterium]
MHTRFTLWAIVFVALFGASCSTPTTATPTLTLASTLIATPTQTPMPTPTIMPNTLVLANGTLIDGTGAPPISNAVIVMRDEKIISVGKRDQMSVPVGARVIDVQGATILPGFINAHVHDAYSARNLEAWAQAGVTTVRDEGILGGSSLSQLIEKRKTEWNNPQFARLVTTGWMMTVLGGYGGLYVSTSAEAQQKANEELDQGADLLKLSMEDGYGSRNDLPLLSLEQIKVIVDVGHARGKFVSAHITEAKYLQIVVDAGVDDAAHMPWDSVSDDVMQRMIAKKIYVVPTLTVMEAYGALAGSQFNLRRFVAMGGQVALGNDYTNIPQNNFPHFELGMPMHEIRRMADANMTPMQIIVAATKNAAQVCHLEKELGTLQVGYIADLLIVDGDPLQDLNALADVRMVIHNGAIIRDENQ